MAPKLFAVGSFAGVPLRSLSRSSLLRLAPGLALAFGLLAAPSAGAALLGLPFTLPAIGVGFAGSSGSTAYDATTGLFSVVADPTAILLTPSSTPIPVTPTLSGERFELTMRVDSTGALAGSPPGADVLLVGHTALGSLGTFDGVLLTGEVRAFGHQDGAVADTFDFRIQVTGGQLAFLFEGADAYVLLGSLESSFAGSFASSFGGSALGNIKVTPAVPEPSAALFFAAGLLLIVRQQR